mgnify:FL=1
MSARPQPTDEQIRAHELRLARVGEAQEAETDELRRQLDIAANIAEGVRLPIDVVARVRKQCGQEILVARCPKCKTVAGLSGEGKHLCRGCYTWLRFRREA